MSIPLSVKREGIFVKRQQSDKSVYVCVCTHAPRHARVRICFIGYVTQCLLKYDILTCTRPSKNIFNNLS